MVCGTNLARWRCGGGGVGVGGGVGGQRAVATAALFVANGRAVLEALAFARELLSRGGGGAGGGAGGVKEVVSQGALSLSVSLRETGTADGGVAMEALGGSRRVRRRKSK